MLKSRAVQAEACVNPYSTVSRLKFLLLHPLTFFFPSSLTDGSSRRR